MKKLIKVLLAAMVVFSLAACSSNSGDKETAEKTEIVIWHQLTDHHEAMLQEIVDEFNASQDKWTVTQLTQPSNEISAKVYEAVTNGTGPNLAWLYPNTALDYVEAGVALDFTPYFTDADYKDRVSAGIYKASTDYPDGKLHAIASTLTGPIMFYNQNLLDKYEQEIPTTWEELYNVCKVIVDGEKAEGNEIVGFGPDTVSYMGILTLPQMGLTYINDDGTITDWTNEKFIDYLKFWRQAEEEHVFQLVDSEGYHSGPFGNGNYVCYLGSSAGIGFITPNGFEMTTGPVPQFEGGNDYTETTVRALIGFTKDEVSDEGAAEFAKFFVNAANNKKFAMTYGAASPYLDVNADEEFKAFAESNPAIKALSSMNDFAGVRIQVANETTAQNEMDRALKQIIIEGADALTTMETAMSVANAALSE